MADGPETRQEAPAQPAEGAAPAEGTVSRIEKEAMTRERIEATQQFIFKKIDRIVFGMLSPKMIKKMSSAKIVTPELYDKEGYPVDGGLMDVRLGVIDPGLRCKTCGSKLKECVGHFGYIELARPVVHIKFVGVVLGILKTSCKECGRVMIPDDKIAKAMPALRRVEKESGPEARRLAVKTIVERLRLGGKCPHCKAKQGKITLEKPSTFMEDDRRVSPIEVRARLERIPDKDIELYGLNPQTARPEWMILTVLPIPPVTMRPSITLETGERSEDDLTHKLGDIVRINQRLFENINAGAPEIIIEDLWDLLQYHVTTFFDNAVPKLPPARHRSGQPLKTLTERIKSKEGRIRHNLAGKRTNFCARTVISPDPMIHINAVGVPRMIAMKLSVPEIVNDWNIGYLKRFVQNGPDTYPGANYIIRPDGKKKKITDETKEALLEEIQPGYVVERHLLDGDIALFNRQPSLHRMSMMCHRVKVLPGRTFRLNPAVCAPYNADFDGDEMNLHIPQSEEARAEAQILMEVSTQLISPRYGASEIGAIQDGISGNYFLTRHLADIPRELAVELLASAGVYDFGSLPRKERLTGRDVFSALLPEDFNYIGESRDGGKVVIKDGRLVEGIIDTLAIGGEGEGLLLRSLHKRYGPQRTIDILHHAFRLGIEVLLRSGLSVNVGNSDLPPDARAEIAKLLQDAEHEVQDMIRQFGQGTLEVIPGRSQAQTLEFKILERLNRARNACKSIVDRHVTDRNHTALIIRSGARGNILNMVQMGAVIGQQALRGGRIDKGYRGRTLSCFKAGDLSPAARGFIRSSYKQGLNPKEFFFGSITGRDALMDTALRTPKSGYLYRRLANALQDIKVEYDGTVRDANGRVIQFDYGDDGIDVARSESGKIDVDRIIEMTE
jgi:DNA-directed RNA polymerase subunit A'